MVWCLNKLKFDHLLNNKYPKEYMGERCNFRSQLGGAKFSEL